MASAVSRSLLATILLASTMIILVTPTIMSQPLKVPLGSPLAAVNGPQKTLVILTRFTDKTNSTRPSQVLSTMSAMNNYYSEDSYGTTTFLVSLTPEGPNWYQLPNTMSYYGVDSGSSDNQLVDDGLRAAYNAGNDLSQYKFATIVHAGDDEAMTHTVSDIHSFTIQGYLFSTGPLTSIKISTSVVAESDPVGVFAHESGHLLGLPDLYDLTGRIDPANNFMGYWDIMALGEWNPNNGPSPPAPAPGTFPALHSVWSKIQLGWLSSSAQQCGPGSLGVCTVSSGQAANLTMNNLEQPISGIQGVKLPVAFNRDGSMTYYLIEMRAKLGTYDSYLPFPPTYPNAGLLIYEVNDSITAGHGNVRLIDAHAGGGLDDAPFGPCLSPCVSQNTFSDQANYVKVIITSTSSTAYSITIDRTAAPSMLLQITISPVSAGASIAIDGVNTTSDSTGQVRLSVRYGPHTLYVQPSIPIMVGSTTVTIGLTNGFATWDDGTTANPRGISVVRDTILTAIYHVTVEPSITLAIVGLLILVVIVGAVTLHHHKTRPKPQPALARNPAAVPVMGTSEERSTDLTPKE